MATRFDTLRTFKAIQAAGVDETAAQAITAAIQDSILDVRDQLATKADLENLRTATKSDFENLRISLTATIDTKIAEVGVKIADMGVKIADVGKSVESAQKTTVFWIVSTGLTLIGVMIAAAVATVKLM